MRILAIGLGGAGGRIVDMLYRTDQRSSRVACVQALAVDVDADSITQLRGLPDTGKIFFPPMDLTRPQDSTDSAPTATIDISEVIARVHTMPTGETDAIFICAGLGGSLVDIAPHLITALRSSMIEPIFGLVTLPCLAEGERCSAKAADDIEMLSPLLDGVIIFDNETWYKKIKAPQKTLARADVGLAARLGLKKKPDQTGSPAQTIYSILNEAIVRRISLILRAGEFKADGGIELAEVVLDAGEIQNTIRGMGFITIGYAVEQLPSHPLSFLTKWRPSGYFADEHQKKASRIVDLAKQAIYHEISAPCDITSAHKALVLIAGPSHELSMKGYMTVRKWIDRSIAGLETRSGDYPVMSTKFVAIIIMLSGLENIPRIEELKEIRAQYKAHLAEEQAVPVVAAGSDFSTQQQGIATASALSRQTPQLRDEMISLQAGKPQSAPERAGEGTRDSGSMLRRPIPHESVRTTPESHGEQLRPVVAKTGIDQFRRHVIVAKQQEPRQTRDAIPTKEKDASLSIKKILTPHPAAAAQKSTTGSPGDRTMNKERERQKIERELQKQRMIAISGKSAKAERQPQMPPVANHKHPSHRPDLAKERKRDEQAKTADAARVILKKQETRKIVLHKTGDRKSQDTPQTISSTDAYMRPAKTKTADKAPDSSTVQQEADDRADSWIKQVSYRKRDELFEGGGVKLKDAPQTARDDALLHTDLKRERAPKSTTDTIEDIKAVEHQKEIEPVPKKPVKKRSDDDLSWVH